MRKLYSLKSLVALLLLTIVPSVSQAARGTELLHLQKVQNNIYAIVGPFGNRTPENLGNNATFGFVETEDGVVLIDSGGSKHGAAAIDKLIKKVTDKPVKVVINTGGQDHRWLGNGYFKEKGARIIASAAAVADQHERLQDQMFILGNLIGVKALEGTDPVYADETFAKQMSFTQGGVYFQLKRVGPAHTPGDILVWLPKEKVVFTGDVVFVGRLLGVMSYSSSRHWLKAFEEMATLRPETVIPGHGPATDLTKAKSDTYDYLVFLRESVKGFIKAGKNMARIGSLDQSRFQYLENFEMLKGHNAEQVSIEMEWE